MATLKVLFAIFILFFSANPGLAQQETAETAERLMLWQLEALKNENYQQFIIFSYDASVLIGSEANPGGSQPV